MTRKKITEVIEPLLRQALEKLGLAEGSWSLELSDESGDLEATRDPYGIFLNYPCLTGILQTDYIRSRVKIEISAK